MRVSNLLVRTGWQKIIAKAGITPWPRLWQNLRASRETELANEYPLHVVTEWIGNSPAIAAKHYLSVTDSHFAKATEGGDRVGRQVETNLPESTDLDGHKPQPLNEETHEYTGNALFVGFSEFGEYARQDSNL
ncbi:MAG: hypothetical protein HYV60_12025 [Planctomycetia bacterium]|nr:hypothetical protein [Planctomycetia bacterium]